MHWKIKENQRSPDFCNLLRIRKHCLKTHSSITLWYNCIQVHQQFGSLTKQSCAKSGSPNIKIYNLFSSGLISFRIDWLDLLAVQRTLESLLQHRSSKASILRCSAFLKAYKLCKILKEMGIPDHLTCLLKNLYAGQEATVRTGHGTTDWFQIGQGVPQGCILSPCLFNLYAEYIMRNTELEETQVESRLLGEISITSDMQTTPCLWQKVKRS